MVSMLGIETCALREAIGGICLQPQVLRGGGHMERRQVSHFLKFQFHYPEKVSNNAYFIELLVKSK